MDQDRLKISNNKKAEEREILKAALNHYEISGKEREIENYMEINDKNATKSFFIENRFGVERSLAELSLQDSKKSDQKIATGTFSFPDFPKCISC